MSTWLNNSVLLGAILAYDVYINVTTLLALAKGEALHTFGVRSTPVIPVVGATEHEPREHGAKRSAGRGRASREGGRDIVSQKRGMSEAIQGAYSPNVKAPHPVCLNISKT